MPCRGAAAAVLLPRHTEAPVLSVAVTCGRGTGGEGNPGHVGSPCGKAIQNTARRATRQCSQRNDTPSRRVGNGGGPTVLHRATSAINHMQPALPRCSPCGREHDVLSKDVRQQHTATCELLRADQQQFSAVRTEHEFLTATGPCQWASCRTPELLPSAQRAHAVTLAKMNGDARITHTASHAQDAPGTTQYRITA